MPDAWLTIDDSPSPHTDLLTDFLAAHGVPAILFCRGDMLEKNPDAIVRAAGKGMVIANHSYSHRPAGSLAYQEMVEEIEKTERLIDAACRAAGKARAGKYFRFPYLDKGDGDRLERRFSEIVADPLGVDLSGNDNSRRLQDYLTREGFTQPFTGVDHPLYRNPCVADAADCLLTYTSCDWMLTERHRGQWQYKTMDDLTRKIDEDPWLTSHPRQIALFHDQPDICDVATGLIRHMINTGFQFR